jgi:hypothetical protein|uniref:Replisome organizer protein n=1 Tax=Siphoviridae sp. ctoyo6 TaxID=2825674 RepID=A0A8S5U392_9CAUD|nr:MAG TPA: replisome organizer protein [Siphoviridae sp. ctoyo6]
MAGRQNKVGLDYFELDCYMDEKVRLVQAEYGLKGFAVFVKLLQEIYGGYGYYCEWTQDRELLFASENGLNGGSQQLLGDIVEACIRRNIFSERLFKEYGILTSSGVQKQYLKATVKREVVELKKEYLLISVPVNRKNVVINSISSGINDISDTGNAQSRVEKSKVYPPISPNGFNCFWEIYPKKVRILKAEEAYRQVLFDDSSVDEEDLKDAAGNYAESVRILDTQERYILNPENFLLRGAYTDYLPGNYKKPQSSKKVQFNQMMHGNYDYAALEKQMLGVDQ